MRGAFVALTCLHGLIHLLGFAKAFGLAALPQLKRPISHGVGALWLAAGALLLLTALLPMHALWSAGFFAVLLSQALIVSAWSDAKFGTLANLIVLAGALYSLAAYGPFSFRAAYAREARQILATAATAAIVTERDLAGLPGPVQRYLRASGSVGQPRVFNFRARWHGRIRGTASEPWMAFTAEQTSGYLPESSRLFRMDATMNGLPVAVLHRFVGAEATFRVRLLSLLPLVDARGAELTRTETVTLFNDLCLLAPSMLLDSAIHWEAVDAHTARAFFSRREARIRADLHFNDAGQLVDFVSEDRSRASADGKHFTRQRWRTPLSEPMRFGAHTLMRRGEARWQDPQGEFAYGEFLLDRIEFNVR